MTPSAPLAKPSIRSALEEFLEEHRTTLPPDELRLYRHVLFFLALCVNNYGHRNLDLDERDVCEKHHRAAFGVERDFFEVFGPEKLLPELDFFCQRFLRQDVHTSARVVERAPHVVEEVRRWLVERGLVSAETAEEERRRAERRSKAGVGARRIASKLRGRVLSVDPVTLPSEDYVPDDHHTVLRVEPGRIWLRVYRSESPEDIGPLLVPQEASRGLGPGWSLRCALGRVRGRWHIVELSEILPRG